jgi:membrane-bound metal-dependent hydrolase YbcI (DUF457 family)
LGKPVRGGALAEEPRDIEHVGREGNEASVQADTEVPSDRELRWISHPVRTAHRKTALAAGVALLTAWFLYTQTRSVTWALIGFGIIVLSLYDFILPTEFRLTNEGVERRILFLTRRRKWSVLHSFYPDRNGVFLSPFPRPSRLEGFRGLYVRYAGNREQVVSYIKDRMRATG